MKKCYWFAVLFIYEMHSAFVLGQLPLLLTQTICRIVAVLANWLTVKVHGLYPFDLTPIRFRY